MGVEYNYVDYKRAMHELLVSQVPQKVGTTTGTEIFDQCELEPEILDLGCATTQVQYLTPRNYIVQHKFV